MAYWKNMNNDTRIWIYQADRLLSNSEVEEIRSLSNSFLDDWTSHGSKMEAAIEIFHNLFVVVFADEAQTKASGCGIDKSVHFIQEIGRDMELDFFNRLNVACKFENEIELIHSSKVQEKINQGKLNDHTLIFNNLIQTKDELQNMWMVPLSASWVSQLL